MFERDWVISKSDYPVDKQKGDDPWVCSLFILWYVHSMLTRHRLGCFRTATAWGGGGRITPLLSHEPKVVDL